MVSSRRAHVMSTPWRAMILPSYLRFWPTTVELATPTKANNPNVWPRLCVDRHVGGDAGLVAEGHATKSAAMAFNPVVSVVEGEGLPRPTS